MTQTKIKPPRFLSRFYYFFLLKRFFSFCLSLSPLVLRNLQLLSMQAPLYIVVVILISNETQPKLSLELSVVIFTFQRGNSHIFIMRELSRYFR